MSWRLPDWVTLDSRHIGPEDARRQRRTATEILTRFDRQPGQILADEVGMGKTFVALAVAVAVIEATRRASPVVVMVPPSVGAKWPLEWRKFSGALQPDPPIRATERAISSGADFLKLLDDPPSVRKHLIFLTHGALSRALSDPLVRLAIVRRALQSSRLDRQRAVFPRWAERAIHGLQSQRLGEEGVERLLATPPSRWRAQLRSIRTGDPGDDPVPRAVREALQRVDLGDLREILRADLPLRSSHGIDARLGRVRSALTAEVGAVWRATLARLDLDLPLLILDEAHHTKNPGTRLAHLFANEEAKDEADQLKGELGGVFRRMLFLTATPFQLGHHELIEVLDRFKGVRWDVLNRSDFEAQLDALRNALDASQAAALRLDGSWGRLAAADVPGNGSDHWWVDPGHRGLSPRAKAAADHFCDAREKARAAERLLQPHVIRHTRADREERRAVMPGAALLPADAGPGGLAINGPAVLPFLLAARAQALVAMSGLREHRQTRALFVDGLASSFEAYTRTRSATALEHETDEIHPPTFDPLPDEVSWYLTRISRSLPEEDDSAFAQHPKVRATVDRAVELWREREKTLVFCFYRATGRALRRHIARAIEREVIRIAAGKLGMDAGDASGVRNALDRFRQRLFDTDAPSRRYAAGELHACLELHLDGDDLEMSVDLCLRFLRTYSFLARYLDLARPAEEALRDAFEARDASGRTFRQIVSDFGEFMAGREAGERAAFFAALTDIDIGDIGVRDDEGEREGLIANVRLANGAVKRETRERLMSGFNTPFYPEVLVASSVMAEGVDLHLMCRNVIHHDLDWNPSVIEQRTGRLDRIGSKGERARLPVNVYLPFIEGAQDEKQFRVMRDRERWFNVVMGERLELDERSTDKLAERVEFPAEAAAEIAMDLAVAER